VKPERLVLASGSASRQEMLREAAVPFEIVLPDVDEDAAKETLTRRGAGSAEIARALAELKAVAGSRSRPDALVLGADQILDCEGRLFSKASTRKEAAATLRALRGRKHQLLSAAVLVRNGAPVWQGLEAADLWMRDFSDDFLEDYLKQEGDTLLSSVGCYRIEGPGVQLFTRISGDTFVIRGLPLLGVLAALREFKILAK
jgi:septum formation protein